MANKEMADFLSELKDRHEMPIDEDEYYLLGSIADSVRGMTDEQKLGSQTDDFEVNLLDNKQCTPICKIIFDVPYYFCGDCKAMLNMYATKAKYCSACGKKVTWKYVKKDRRIYKEFSD